MCLRDVLSSSGVSSKWFVCGENKEAFIKTHSETRKVVSHKEQ